MNKFNTDEIRIVNPGLEQKSGIDQLALSSRIVNCLTQAGITDIRELIFRMETEPDSILAVGGIGPQSVASIRDALKVVQVDAPEYQEPVALLAEQTETEVKQQKDKIKKQPKEKKVMAKDAKSDKKKTKKKDDKGKDNKVKAKEKDKKKVKDKQQEKKKKAKKSKKTDKTNKNKKESKKKNAKKKKGKKN